MKLPARHGQHHAPKVPCLGGRRPRAAGACAAGWLQGPVRPEPPDDPPPPLSLAWWIYAPGDPGLSNLDMVPVGRFSSFVPRAIAANIRAHAPFSLADVADAYVQQDGRELMVALYAVNGRAASVHVSGDGGVSWQLRDSNSP